jgi:hypothetical protein
MPDSTVEAGRRVPVGVDPTRASIARVYDAFLNGKDNYEIDREVFRGVQKAAPEAQDLALENRAFLIRVCRFLATQTGIDQYLDCGSGLPTAENVHQVVQRITPDATVVYVDNDPVVLAHARALLTSTPEGATDYIDADLRNAEQILAKAAETLDFSKPVAVMLMAILQHLSDENDPYEVVARLVAAVPSGSYLALSHPARDIHAAEMAEMAKRLNQMMAEKVTFRSQSEVAPFFAGLELLEPGMTNVPDWRPETAEEASSPAALWAGVARKP